MHGCWQCALILICSEAAHAQDLEPRAYSPNPVGINFVVLGLGHSTGNVLLDPSLPVTDVDARLTAGLAGFGRTFGLFDRSASVAFVVPYVDANVSGSIGEERRVAERLGFGDPRLRLALNLMGGEALTPAQFAKRKPRRSLGASVVIVPPLGEYDSTKLINLGSNRWSFKPELGFSQPIGRWYLELYAGLWLFTDNAAFFGGTRRQQDAMPTLQAHVSYTVRPHLWIAADATHYRGGQTTIDGSRKRDTQSNSRVGITISMPISSRQSLKFSWSDGVATRIGGDFTSYAVAWQYTWVDQ
jgi:hypothetical protein